MTFHRKRRSSSAVAKHAEFLHGDKDSDICGSGPDDAHLKLGDSELGNHNRSRNDPQRASSRKSRKRLKHHLPYGAHQLSSLSSSHQVLRFGDVAAVVVRQQQVLPAFGDAVSYHGPTAVSDDEEDEVRENVSHRGTAIPLRCRDYQVSNSKKVALSSSLAIIGDYECASPSFLPSHCSWVAKPLAPPPRLALLSVGRTIALQSRMPDFPPHEDVKRNLSKE
jgi:hypothetical protein